MPSDRSIPTFIAVLVFVIAAAGCARSTVTQSLIETYSAPDQELDFFAELEEQRVISNNDALHTLFLLADQQDPHNTYAERAREAALRGWIPDHKYPSADESAAIGTVAVAVVDILNIEGGLSLRVFRDSPRYATRELIFMGLLPPRTENQAISGLEMIDLVGRVDRRLAAK